MQPDTPASASSAVQGADRSSVPSLPTRFLPTPTLAEFVAAGAALVALVALALVRCDLTDTPYHLATARWAFTHGSWPTTNTFSYTHPEYPLYQQYPVYQTILYGIYTLAGWEGLSLFHAVAWGGLFLLWLRWWGPWPWGIVLSFPLVVLVLGLRERMVLRPDILTMLYFVLLLHLADLYLAGRRWAAWCMPAVLFHWVNSHQMFWVGLAIEGALLLHLLLVNGQASGIPWIRRFIPEQKVAKFWPILLAFGLSLLASLFSPIGWRVLEVPWQTMGSLYFHRQNVDEFASFTTSRQAIWLVSVSGLAAIVGILLRGKRQVPFEVLVWLMSLAMVLGAIRGSAFFVAVSLGIFARGLGSWISREPVADPSPIVSAFLVRIARGSSVVVALLLCGQIYWARWVEPTHILGGSQFGIGRTLGAWPDDAVAFLRKYPPPGNMINLSWYSGNAFIWDLPELKVFVDPRFEAYPRSFLIDSLAAEKEISTLDRLLDIYEPDWFVGELRVPSLCQQMARLVSEGSWQFVYVDPNWAILVRRTESTRDYLEEHPVNLEALAPKGLLREYPELLAQQEARLATLLADLGKTAAARRWYLQAQEAKHYSNVALLLRELRRNHPEIDPDPVVSDRSF